MSAPLDAHGSQLRGVNGVGAITAARLIGRTDRGFTVRTRSRPTQASRRSRSPAETNNGTGCHVAAIVG